MSSSVDIITLLANLPSTELADAGSPDAPVGVMTGLTLRAGSGRFCGVAHTVRTHPGDLRAVIEGVDSIRAGQVLVVDGGGRADAALFGDIMSEICVGRGVVGVVVDGAVRDLPDLCKAGLTVYSRHVYPGARTITGPGSVGVPVFCGGVTVQSNDIICADESGIVVVRASDTAAVLDAAEKVGAMEKNLQAKLDADPSTSLMDALGL